MRKFKLALPMIAVAILVSGCATRVGGACDGWSPIRPTRADTQTMSDRLVEQVLAHNEHGAKVCGWK